ncbi:MAG: hypothetical protein JNK26_04990 [Candidatus Doudnabacteria bacterium]|nr:hypothetical protein [Candidatus Doudnabacteria bacterium]
MNRLLDSMMDFDTRLLEIALKKYKEVYGEEPYSQLEYLLDNDIEKAETTLIEFIDKYKEDILKQLKS